MKDRLYDCIIIGAGPGGLQAAIYLGRYNRDALLLDRSGGRTWHARHIENVLAHPLISGREIIERGLEQARHFQVEVRQETVTVVRKEGRTFEVGTAGSLLRSRYVIVSSGVYDVLPKIENLHRFFGDGYYTCLDCDGYRTAGRKLVVLGNNLHAVNLSLAMAQLYTSDVTLVPVGLAIPDSSAEVLKESAIPVIPGEPKRIIGDGAMEALELADGRRIPCEAIMASFGTNLNDGFLRELPLKRDAEGFKYTVNSVYESSLPGLYIVGPLNTGQDQVVIAAGEGAVAAIDINKRLLEEKESIGEVCSLDGAGA